MRGLGRGLIRGLRGLGRGRIGGLGTEKVIFSNSGFNTCHHFRLTFALENIVRFCSIRYPGKDKLTLDLISSRAGC